MVSRHLTRKDVSEAHTSLVTSTERRAETTLANDTGANDNGQMVVYMRRAGGGPVPDLFRSYTRI